MFLDNNMIVFSLAIGQMGKPGLFQSQSSVCVCVCVYGACSNSVHSVYRKGEEEYYSQRERKGRHKRRGEVEIK